MGRFFNFNFRKKEVLAKQEPKIKIIITEDMAIFRQGLINALAKKNDLDIIGEAVNGQDLLDKLEYLHPDIILLNIQMPVLDGLSTLPILKEKYPAIKVIMLSYLNDYSVIRRMMELGANSYVTKESGGEEVYKAILICHRDEYFFNETVMDALLNKKKERLPNPDYTYSPNDLIILKLLQKGKTIEEIAPEVGLMLKTIEAIIDRLKINTGSQTVEALMEFAVKIK
ncbi:MAG: response regulator transcription factor [Chitinophagaceae bacterium]|nr:response regulator transcription factor [Chitinophagaceae bacterium]